MKNIRIAFIILILLFSFIYLSATIINIPDDYAQIQQGINVSTDGDTILVQPGTYYENINYNGYNVVVGSMFLTTQDSSYIEQTIINGSQNGSVIMFESGENSNAVLTGFIITNGSGSLLIGYGYLGGGGICCYQSSPVLKNLIIENNNAEDGGGIVCYSNSDPLIFNCIISENTASGYDGDGGGINLKYSNPRIQNTKISNNYAHDNGGGLTCSWSSPIIKNVLISNNIAYDKAGGLSCGNDSDPILFNVILANNSADDKGGSIYCSANGDLILINSTIANNQSPWSSIYTENSELLIINCIIYNDNSPQEIIATYGSEIQILFSNIQDGWQGEGNIDEDPQFINQYGANYHLHNNSPCIGAGIDEIEINNLQYYSPPYDFDGSSRPLPIGSLPDMGAYENPYGEPVGIYNESTIFITNTIMNYPNPFNPTTTISFEFNTETAENTELIIYNLRGQKIREYSIFNNQSSLTWNGTDESGKPVSSGVYLYKLKSDGKTIATRKMLLMK